MALNTDTSMFDSTLSIREIEQWLREECRERLAVLWTEADAVRARHVGHDVHLRGLLEISNHCVQRCAYCGLSVRNRGSRRYRMTQEEIIQCAYKIVEYGYGTVVMQAGEDYGIETEALARIVHQIKTKTPLAVTLSMGERPIEDIRMWRNAGADRYLLRFETSDTALYRSIHPNLPGRVSDRIGILAQLKGLGYEVGSGVMIGIPGQTYTSLARDVDLFRQLDLDMVGVGPYIPHPGAPLGKSTGISGKMGPVGQVPNTEMMTYKVIALARLMCPESNIPATTALATINRESGRETGLSRGANVVMPNVTPVAYRQRYDIYPGKACLNETAEACRLCLANRIKSIGRSLGTGPGDRRRGHRSTSAM